MITLLLIGAAPIVLGCLLGVSFFLLRSPVRLALSRRRQRHEIPADRKPRKIGLNQSAAGMSDHALGRAIKRRIARQLEAQS